VEKNPPLSTLSAGGFLSRRRVRCFYRRRSGESRGVSAGSRGSFKSHPPAAIAAGTGGGVEKATAEGAPKGREGGKGGVKRSRAKRESVPEAVKGLFLCPVGLLNAPSGAVLPGERIVHAPMV